MDSQQIVPKSKKYHHYSPFPSCFRRPLEVAAAAAPRRLHLPPTPPPQPPVAANPNLATSLYNTHLGLFALTWSRNLFGRSFHIHFLLNDSPSSSAVYGGDGAVDCNSVTSSPGSTPSFHLHIKPFIFWKKNGSKKLDINGNGDNKVHIYWDLSKAKFGSGPEPRSGFYIAVTINGEMILLVGDLQKEAYAKTKARKSAKNHNQNLVLRREHVCGNKLYKTKANFNGKEREISIDCRLGEDPRLYFCVDNKRVLQIKHLKWKFRGNERIEVDGVQLLVSWDVYNWLFDDDEDGYALFIFKFEKSFYEDEQFNNNGVHQNQMWSQQSCGFGFETKMMKKGVLRSSRSSSSSSLSSASSTCSSSVMEWASTEENELKGPSGFSLLVYAWKS